MERRMERRIFNIRYGQEAAITNKQPTRFFVERELEEKDTYYGILKFDTDKYILLQYQRKGFGKLYEIDLFFSKDLDALIELSETEKKTR